MSDTHTDTLHEIEELKKQVAELQGALDKLTQNNTPDAAQVPSPVASQTISEEVAPVPHENPAATQPVQAPAPVPVAEPAVPVSAPAPAPAPVPMPAPVEPQAPVAGTVPVAGTAPVQGAPVYGQVPVDSGYATGQGPVPPAGFNQTQYQAAQQQWSAPAYSTANQAPVIRHKDHVAAALLAIFLGGFGVHKFYLGYNTAGFIMLGVTLLGSILTFGFAAAVVWLIGLVEGIVYLVKTQDEFENLYIRNKREWF